MKHWSMSSSSQEVAIPTISVAVIEDEEPLRELLAIILRRAGGYEVATPPVEGWVEWTAREQPDVLLLDLLLDGSDALQDLHRVVVDSPRTMIAPLTALSAEDAEPRALAAGAFVFYEKSMINQLPDMIREDHALFERALAGEEVVAPSALLRRPPGDAEQPSLDA